MSVALLPSGAERLQGQAVQGRVIDAETRRPVADAVVRLVDGAGVARVTAASDQAGRFRLAAPETGRWLLRVERIGYETLESRAFTLETDTTHTIEVPLRPSPVEVEGIAVSVDQVNRRLRTFFGVSLGQLRFGRSGRRCYATTRRGETTSPT